MGSLPVDWTLIGRAAPTNFSDYSGMVSMSIGLPATHMTAVGEMSGCGTEVRRFWH
jgi:hypothetical protein